MGKGVGFGILLVLIVFNMFFVSAIGSYTTTVESDGSAGYRPSLALDSNGKVHISSVHGGTFPYKLRYCNNTLGSWICANISNTHLFSSTSIAIDSNNKVYTSYWNASGSSYNPSYCNNTLGNWGCKIVPGSWGFFIDFVPQGTSIAIDSNNKIHISTTADASAEPDYFAEMSYANESGIKFTTGDGGGYSGTNPSIAIDSNNKSHISYNKGVSQDLVYCNNTLGSFSCATIDSTGNVGTYSSINFDSNGKIHISYSDDTNNNLKYCNNTLGPWSCATIDSGGFYSSIAIDSNDKIHIVHRDSFGGMRYCNNIEGTWNCYSVVSGNVVLGDRTIAIKQGRLVDSTSFSDLIHISWQNASSVDLMYTIIDLFYPTIQYESQTTTAGNYSRNYIEANITANDTGIGLNTTTIYLYNSTGLVQSNISTTSPFFWNITNLVDGTYYLNATANDTGNNLNQTETRTITLDTTAPTINFGSNSTSSSNLSQSYIFANITSVDNLIGLSNIAIFLYNSTSLVNSTILSSSPVSLNFTNLADGTYYLNATANDTLGNENTLSTRIITLDTTLPTLSFVCTPTSVDVGGTISCSCSGTDATSGVQVVSYTQNPGTSTAGTFTESCEITDYAGNTQTSSTHYTVNTPASGGGGGGGTAEGSPTLEKTNLIISISPETGVTIKSFDAEIGIKEIKIEVSNDVNNVRIIVKKYDEKPANVTIEKRGKVYRYLEFETQNLEDKLEKATVIIQVEKQWVSDNNLSSKNILIYKFNNNSELWNELNTIYESEDESYYYYNTVLDSFSFFAIAEKLSIVEMIASDVTESYGGAGETIYGLIVWWLVFSILLVGILLNIVIITGFLNKGPKNNSNARANNH